MDRFWKFNSFVGTVGLLMVVAAFFFSTHVYSYDNVGGVLTLMSASTVNEVNKTSVLGGVGTVLMLWQVAMTLIGLLAGFFRAPTSGR